MILSFLTALEEIVIVGCVLVINFARIGSVNVRLFLAISRKNVRNGGDVANAWMRFGCFCLRNVKCGILFFVSDGFH